MSSSDRKRASSNDTQASANRQDALDRSSVHDAMCYAQSHRSDAGLPTIWNR